VVHIKEVPSAEGQEKQQSMEDHVTIKSGESRVVVERGRIARVVGSPTAGATA
jgi:hypothetical protein